MNSNGAPGSSLGLIFRPALQVYRLRVNDVIRVDGKLGRVIRVTECAAVVLVNMPAREFITRFDKRVKLQPAPQLIRIAANPKLKSSTASRSGSAFQSGLQLERSSK